MRTRIVRIGDSRGVRLSKSLLDQVGLRDKVEIEAQGNRFIIRPARAARAGWENAFARMAAEHDDGLLDGEAHSTSFDQEDWSW